MSYRLRKAIRTEAKPLIGLYAESGGGKTKSSLLLAKGFCGDMAKVCMIETEAGRGEAWANDPIVGGYSVVPIRGDFSPKNYGAAIGAAEEGGVQVLIIDSASHEWEGVGGVLGMAAANQEAGKKGPLVWQKPKMEHKREFMLRLLQTPVPLVIVCMRAKYPMIEKKKQSGEKEWARSEKLDPIQADDILFDMFVHGWMDQETHSFHGTKYTLDDLKQVFIDGQPISIQTGERLALWSKGSAAPQAGAGPSSSATSPAETAPIKTRTDSLKELCARAGVDYETILGRADVKHADEMTDKDYSDAKAALEKRIAKKAA